MRSVPFIKSIEARIVLGASVAIFVCALAITWLTVEKSREVFVSDRYAALLNRLERSKEKLVSTCAVIQRDVVALAKLPQIQRIVSSVKRKGVDPGRGIPAAAATEQLKEIFATFAEADPSYFQIRFIGIANDGLELVRVDVANGKATATPPERLQSKGDRDYFKATTRLREGEVYLSEIDLNREFGKVQVPHVRTMRAATPVFTREGDLFGMVVINLDIGPAIDEFTAASMPGVSGYLTNSRGDFLAHPDSSRTFGFDLGRRYTLQEEMSGVQVPSIDSEESLLQTVSMPEGSAHLAIERVQIDPRVPEQFVLLAYTLPESVIQAHVAGVRNTVAAGVVGAGLLLLGSIILFTRRTFAPLTELTALASTISEGRYDVVLPRARGGEMGIFIRAFGGMLDRIKTREQEISSAAAEVRRSHARLETTLENLTEGVAVSDLDGRLLHFNRAAIEVHGFTSPEEYLRQLPEFADTFELASPDGPIWPVDQWPLARILSGEVLRNLEVNIRRKRNGWRRVFSYGGSLVRNADGQANLAIVTMRDITDRKEAERRIQGQLERLGLLDHITRAIGERQDLKSIYQVVVRHLEDSLPIDFGCICQYNAAATTLLVSCVGVKSKQVAHELTIAENAQIDVDGNGLARCVSGQLVYEPDIGESRFPFPSRLARAGLRSLVMAPLRSESRVFGVLIVARRGPQGFSSGQCEFLRQLSEHVAVAAHQAQLFASLQQAYDDLRQTQQVAMQEERLRALGQMASGIAHDINNSLSPVSLYTESMLEGEQNLSPRARGYLEVIQRSVEDVSHTVARMREFYRQREQQIELAPVDINEVMQQVLDLTKARWSDQALESGVVIRAEVKLAPDVPKIMGVESEIRESLTNLVFNAVDAMPDGGTLTLRSQLAGTDADRLVIVEVVDSGIGMNEETRRRCLEPFFTTKGERGTGLGLAMVFGMVQRHSCTLEIDSTPGAGTTMRLIFADSAAAILDPEQSAETLILPPSLRLLLIDDDPMLLKSLRDALETDGHTVTTASGGEAGIAEFRAALERRAAFHAVITDLGMPYVDGRKVAAAIKEASPATPVILLTGWGRRMVADDDIPAHVDRVLAKPPKLREVREALTAVLMPGGSGPLP
jgi:PAS domain S-box-containing protein